ncbi:phosphatidate cytidylyltransferase [Henriciella aquimarina]|uniref:phosphatidate cytidylyltransferase n=1 Tax=Henriciella aquimarina TaxID=545261 RepID=UPI0009FCFAAD|nr:phosphatidate cytidylyltransferase [Henriciella aquimarina]
MTASSPANDKMRELLLRLLSAAVLIPFALYVVSTGGPILAISCAVFGGIMGFEWARMTASPIMPVTAFFCALPSLAMPFVDREVALLVMLACAALVLLLHPSRVSERMVGALGIFYAAGLPLSMYLLRDGAWNGQAAALIAMGTVWASDSGAYFAGRGFGGPPLSPKDSPSKTWSGALGGLLCSGLCGLIAAGLMDAPRLPWLFAGLLMSFLAQWGDLFESSLKRRYGVKDSSDLVPGHGGVMDRVDGLGMVCIMAVVVFVLFGTVPEILGLDA